ncbi:MAG TPA: NUDIX domain-containing protein, partial [Flavobacteriaceae bacterium]|nr:NUDIX domain-containing protein [Flavobacteriaceae bacterium]
FDNGLTEHEFDHVLIGHYNEDPNLNPEEVADWKWASPEEIRKEIKSNPEKFTAWFKIIFEKYDEHLK